MAVTLIVRMKGKAGHGDALRGLLDPLPKDNDIPGCMGWEIFSNAGNGDEILILERWESIEAHKAFIDPLVASGALGEVLSNVETIDRAYYCEAQSV